jgi:hypothetical protein
MWKICQAFRARYESFVSHSTPLPPLYSQRYLASFHAGFGILIIEGKKQKRLSPTAGPFAFCAHEHASLQSAPGSRLPATGSVYHHDRLCNTESRADNKPGRVCYTDGRFHLLCLQRLSRCRPRRHPLSAAESIDIPHGWGRGWGGCSYRLPAASEGRVGVTER